MSFWNLSISIGSINLRISSPPPLTPPTRGGEKTFPPPRWGRLGGGAQLLQILLFFKDYALVTKTVRLEFWRPPFIKSSEKFQKDQSCRMNKGAENTHNKIKHMTRDKGNYK